MRGSRENMVELRKLREAAESLEQGGSSDLIDIWFLSEIRFYVKSFKLG